MQIKLNKLALYFISTIFIALTAECESTSPLIEAARESDTATVQALLEAGTDVEAKSVDGTTALLVGAENGHTNIVQALLEAGADTYAKNEDGVTALMLVAVKGHTDIVQAIRKTRMAKRP